MNKATRLKAARRKQHNKSAKARALEWTARCAVMRQEGEAARARRVAEATATANISEPLPPVDPLAKLLEGYLDGSQVMITNPSQDAHNLMQILPTLWRADGTLDVLELAKRKLPVIDTEGIRPFKLGNPRDKHTVQCMARHHARVAEAVQAEADLLAKGEEALACYLLPVLMACTCDEHPGVKDGQTPA